MRSYQLAALALSLLASGLGHVRQGRIKTGMAFATLHGGFAALLTVYVVLIPATDPWYVLPFLAALFLCAATYVASALSVVMVRGGGAAVHRAKSRTTVAAGIAALLLVYSPSLAVLFVLWTAPDVTAGWMD